MVTTILNGLGYGRLLIIRDVQPDLLRLKIQSYIPSEFNVPRKFG